jgi:hypothetical protein
VFAPNNIGRVGVTIRGGVVLDGHGDAAIALGQSNRVKLRLQDVTIRDNPGSAVANCSGLKIKASDIIVSNNAAGLCGDGLRLDRATITDNDFAGVFSWTARVRLRDSTVTGNNAGGDNFDIATHKRPRLRGTTCDRSVQLPDFPGLAGPASPSWGVCTND